MFKYIEIKESSIIIVQNIKWGFAASKRRRTRRRGKIVTIWNQDHQHLYVFSKYLVLQHSLTTNFRPICMPRVKCTTQESDCLFSEVFEILLKLVLLSRVMCPLELNWILLGTWIWWQQSTEPPVCTSAGWWTKSSELPARWEPDGELVSIHDQPSN